MGDSMKKIILLLVLFMLCGCTSKPLTSDESLKIIVASDIHYFLKDYYQECEWFEDNMLYGDGKMVTYADEIIDAFVQDVISEKPDLVVLTGDLSFNGEKGSHEGLAAKLTSLTKAGIHVAVIPGNHDVDNIFAKGYGKDDYFDVEKTNAQDFRTIYKDLGYQLAVSTHKESLSYRIDLNERYSLFMMDSNAHELTKQTLGPGGFLTESTMNWLEEELKNIQSQNKIPLFAMHHNLTNHNPLLNNGYTIADHQKIADLMQTYQTPFVLSGHIHCQNIKEINGIYDIASASLLDAPLQYGIIEIDNQHMNYHTQSLTISIDADEYFDQVSRNTFSKQIEKINDEKKQEAILDVLVKANRYYFAGTISDYIDEIKQMQGYDYMKEEDLEFCKNYLESLLNEEKNSQQLSLEFSSY